MDLIIPGSGTLTVNQEKELRYSFNSFDDDYCKKKQLQPKDYLFQSNKCFQRLQDIKPIWKNLSRDSKVKESHYFYDCIFRCKGSSSSKTEWISTKIDDEKYTSDHPFTARLVMRIIMDDWPSFMDNFHDFSNEINFLTQTIGISKKENQDVKVQMNGDGEIKLEKTTLEKYSSFEFKHKITGEIKKGLPFIIPEWFQSGEKKRLYTKKELFIKNIKKCSKTELVKKANNNGISIFNNGKRKTISILREDLIKYHNDQMLL